MRSFKHFGALAAVMALCAIGAGSAQAESRFTSSAGSGTISGTQTTNQVFNTTGGSVTCAKAAVSGTIKAKESTEQELAVAYSECKAFGVATAHISNALWLVTANHGAHLLNTVTITVTKTLFTAHCTFTFTPQTPSGTVDFTNLSGGGLSGYIARWRSGLRYHVTNAPCGTEGEHTDGTFEGSVEVKPSSGTISWDE